MVLHVLSLWCLLLHSFHRGTLLSPSCKGWSLPQPSLPFHKYTACLSFLGFCRKIGLLGMVLLLNGLNLLRFPKFAHPLCIFSTTHFLYHVCSLVCLWFYATFLFSLFALEDSISSLLLVYSASLIKTCSVLLKLCSSVYTSVSRSGCYCLLRKGWCWNDLGWGSSNFQYNWETSSVCLFKAAFKADQL